MGKLGLADTLISLLIAVVIIYVGIEILYPINPFLAIVFFVLAAYLVVKSLGGGGR
jgi:hypothetical protein